MLASILKKFKFILFISLILIFLIFIFYYHNNYYSYNLQNKIVKIGRNNLHLPHASKLPEEIGNVNCMLIISR